MKRLKAWIKTHREWIVFFGILFLLLVASFGFGYFIGKETHPAPIIIEKKT